MAKSADSSGVEGMRMFASAIRTAAILFPLLRAFKTQLAKNAKPARWFDSNSQETVFEFQISLRERATRR
jgi:hypothetical protein